MRRHPTTQHGFTLVEMIVVIVITGIIGGIVAMFIRAPVQGYVDSARRADMSDVADTALRRLARDVSTAAPNSLRTPNQADSSYIEFLPTKDGGRYRVTDVGAGACGASGNELSFDSSDTCFEIVGTPITFSAGDEIVVGSQQSDGNSAYCKSTTCNVTGINPNEPGALRDYTGAAGSQKSVVMAGAAHLDSSLEVDGHRFEVVPGDQQAVTYACMNMQGGSLDANGDGQGSLTRYWAYGIVIPQPVPPLGVSSATLASNVSDCHFVYNPISTNNSLLAVRLTITRGKESVTLYQEIHINNTP